MNQQEKSRELEELAYELYTEFYENPNQRIHYAELNQKLAMRDLPTGLQFADFLADCVDLGVSHSNSDRQKMSKSEMVDSILD